MPYYLTKVTNHLKNISKVSRPTFMIEQLSSFVLDKHPLDIAEWLQNIAHAMDNPKKIIHIILFQPSKKDEINTSDASFILHLCPAQAVNAFINNLANPDINWIEKHNNWLETFEDMCNKIDSLNFDIAILGCGSYGMPLAHYIKKIGKSSIYAGAYAQVMFGIKGKRWDVEGNPHRSYWNEHWKWPEEDEIPKNAEKVEGGCYWK